MASKYSVLIIDGNLLARKSFYKFKNLKTKMKKSDFLELFPADPSDFKNEKKEENEMEEIVSQGSGNIISVNNKGGISEKIKRKLEESKEIDIPTGVCFGMLRSIIVGVEQTRAKKVVVCYDPVTAETQIRSEMAENYKDRKRDPDIEMRFRAELQMVIYLIHLMNIEQATSKRFEADDLLQYYSKVKYKENKTYILTNDNDILQLLSNRDSLLKIGSEYKIYAKKDFIRDYGISKPFLWRDVKAIGGCQSDNVKGIKGISEESAIKLVSEFGSIKEIYKALENGKIPKRLRGILKKERENKFKNLKLSRKLVSLYGKTEELKKDMEILEKKEGRKEKLKLLFYILKELKMNSLLKEDAKKAIIRIGLSQ